MAVFETSVAAATAVVGYDLLTTLPYVRTSGGGRVLRAAGLAGSAAAQDTRVAIQVGGVKIGQLYNGATGGINNDRDMTDFGDAWIPPGEALSVLIEDAPATNAINLRVVVEELAG